MRRQTFGTLYRPARVKHPDVLVVHPFPLAGTPENSKDRLLMTAHQAGVLILGFQVTGTGFRTYIDFGSHDLSRQNFHQTSQTDASLIKRIADSIAESTEYLSRDHQLLGWLDSARGSNGLAMQQSSQLFPRGLLLRDCINLNPGYRWSGMAGVIKYNLSGDEPTPDTPVLKPPLWRQAGNAVRGAVEIFRYSEYIATNETYMNSVELAADHSLPVNIKQFTNGFGGREPEIRRFMDTLTRIRERKANEISGWASAAGLSSELITGGHVLLMSPLLAATHIQETLELPQFH